MVHARTHVYLNDPGIQILIDHEIVPDHLKKPSFASHTPFASLDAPNDDIFYFLLDNFPFLNSNILAKSFHIPHAVLNGSRLVILLDGIVREMLKLIVNVVETVLVSAKPQVAFFVKPNDWRIVVLDEHPLSDIKFLSVDQKGVFNVFLDYKLTVLSNTVICNIV